MSHPAGLPWREASAQVGFLSVATGEPAFRAVTNALSIIEGANELMVVQRKELVELFGFETRNKYAIEIERRARLDVRRRTEVRADSISLHGTSWGTGGLRDPFSSNKTARNLVFRAVHPFRFFFQRLEVTAGGQ